MTCFLAMWLSQEDLALVEDRHWDAWAIPEKLVVLAKIEAGPTHSVTSLTSLIS